MALRVALFDVEQEIASAIANWPPMNSAHEGFAVLAEEVDEFAIEVCDEDRGRR